MKRFLVTLAAMLLVGIGAFAQSTTPLQGDVNEDGVVDVADIVAVIDIMKDGSLPTYQYYLSTSIPASTPTFNITSRRIMKLENLTGWDNWKNQDNQYIVFPKKSGKSKMSDYFDLRDGFGGSFLSSDCIVVAKDTSSMFVVQLDLFAPLGSANGQNTITFK